MLRIFGRKVEVFDVKNLLINVQQNLTGIQIWSKVMKVFFVKQIDSVYYCISWLDLLLSLQDWNKS